ncbi:M48 family metallopeptidase [Desulfoluna sp.]|uniref:M48 family metallopeptidase n=1 Tax=Desulfoluna sp. TaxID=2045199 RepID=UPI00263101AA|nr:M48 family metallopeptidase [Desulfoluna sp.]
MKFKPRPLARNVNVSQGSRLWDLCLLLSGMVAGLVLLFILAGFFVDSLVKFIPPSYEDLLGHHLTNNLDLSEDPRLDHILQRLEGEFAPDEANHTRHFRIGIIDREEINAVALPGGTIVVFSGLLKEVASENELAMIVGHELGHFAHQDHLTRLGRVLLFGIASRLVLGEAISSRLTAFFTRTLHASYSRRQETAADLYGLSLLVKAYGHAGGAVDFFIRIAERRRSGRLAHLVASHPHPEDRIEILKKTIQAKGWPVSSKIALPETPPP